MRHWLTSVAFVSLLALSASANEPALDHPTSERGHAAESEAFPHPTIPESASWPGVMVIVVLALFLAAAVIGPIVRDNMPAEVASARGAVRSPSPHARHRGPSPSTHRSATRDPTA